MEASVCSQSPSTSAAGLVVCILGADERATIIDTIASARRHGLPVHVAVVARRPILEGLEGVWQHLVDWNGDFAWARNQLLERIHAKLVLWLDSDERLLAFPACDAGQLSEDFYAVPWQADRLTTPGQQIRLHRLDPAIRWRGPVHEQPCRDGVVHYSARRLPGALILHDGYEDPSVLEEKLARNQACVRSAIDTTSLHLGELLAIARRETKAGRFDFMSWLEIYRHPEAQPEGIHYDRRYEPAYMLSSAGYDGFARALLRANPMIVPLQLAVLADGWRKRSEWDEERIDLLLHILNNACFDGRYAFPLALLACDRDTLVGYLKDLAAEWHRGNRVMHSAPDDEIDPLLPYTRDPQVLGETLDDDLVLMHPTTLQVVMLNPVAAILWDALRWPMSLADLASLLREAYPGEDVAGLENHVRETLSQLIANGLIHAADAA